jgi:hypothetical protein
MSSPLARSKRNLAVSSSSTTQPQSQSQFSKCPFKRRQATNNHPQKNFQPVVNTSSDVTTKTSPGVATSSGNLTTPEGDSAQLPNSTRSNGYDSGGMGGMGGGGYGGMGMNGMGGMGMGGMGGMGMGGMGMGGYGMGGMGMGGYGMGGMGMDGGFMGPLMNQLMMVQSLNYTLMSFGQIVQSMGINASSILEFGQNILRTLDTLAIAIKKSGILSPSSSASTTAVLSEYQRDKNHQIRKRRRAVLIRWTLVILTMAVTSQAMRILKYFANSSLPSTLAQHIFHFFRSFFISDSLIPSPSLASGPRTTPPSLLKTMTDKLPV